MTKERERLAFDWQKSYNQYMFLFTIIVTLFTSQSLIPKAIIYQKIYYWLMAISLTLFGISLITFHAKELVYRWQGLRDKRKKVKPFEKYLAIIVYVFNCIMGLVVIALGVYLMGVLLGCLPNIVPPLPQ